MATVDDLDSLEPPSIEGMYTLLVNFNYGVDVNAELARFCSNRVWLGR